MINKESAEKKYMELVMPGHYIDVQSNELEWKIARVVEKDKRCFFVSYDGWLSR
jgi:hypothetical protein